MPSLDFTLVIVKFELSPQMKGTSYQAVNRDAVCDQDE